MLLRSRLSYLASLKSRINSRTNTVRREVDVMEKAVNKEAVVMDPTSTIMVTTGTNIIDIMETIWVVVVEIITITVISHTEVI